MVIMADDLRKLAREVATLSFDIIGKLMNLPTKEKRQFLAEGFRKLRVPVGPPEPDDQFPIRTVLIHNGKEIESWRKEPFPLFAGLSPDEFEQKLTEMGLKYVRFDKLEAEFDYEKAIKWLWRVAGKKMLGSGYKPKTES